MEAATGWGLWEWSEGTEEGRGQRGALSCGVESARCMEELRLHQLVD